MTKLQFYFSGDLRIVNITDLMDDTDAMTALASSMDDYHKNTHMRLGEWLIENKKIENDLKKKLGGLQRFFHGGGSPTLAFLDANSSTRPNDLVKKFRDHAKNKHREDVIKSLVGIGDNEFLENLPDSVKAEIADHLDKRVIGVADWESFASHFKYTHDQREVFRAAKSLPGSFSPTKALFQILKHRNGNLPVQLIIQWAKSEGRNDISIALDKFIQDKTIEWQANQPLNNSQVTTNDLDSNHAVVMVSNQSCFIKTSEGPSESYETGYSTPASTTTTATTPTDDEAQNSTNAASLARDEEAGTSFPLNENGEPDLC